MNTRGDAEVEQEGANPLHFVTIEEMRRLGLRLVGYSAKQLQKAKTKRRNRWFKQAFGITHLTAAHVYRGLQTTHVEEAKIAGSDQALINFLMGVFYLRKYPMESDLERTFGYSETEKSSRNGSKQPLSMMPKDSLPRYLCPANMCQTTTILLRLTKCWPELKLT